MTTNRITSRSGTGAAHLGYAMFGARGPLLSPEGDGAGGATTTTEGAAGSAATSAGAGDGAAAKTFTQSEVDQIVKDRLAKVKQAPAQAATVRPPADDGERLTLASLKASLDVVNERAERAEFRSEALEHGFRKEVLDDAFALHQAQKPADRAEWFKTKSTLFGGSGATTGSSAAGTTTTASTTQAGAKPQAVAPGAPSGITTFVDHGGVVDLYSMDASKLASLTPTQIREIHARNVAAASTASGAPPSPRFGMQKK